MAKTAAEVQKRIEDLLRRASDPAASEEEKRTSAVIAAKLIREHGISIGAPPSSPPPPLEVTHARVHVVIDKARTVVEAVGAARPGLAAALGFDVFGFAQELIRERVQTAIADSLKAPAPRPRAKRKKAR